MRQGGQISGLVSLMTIFCSLSLCVFAILTLATADRERRLAELNAQRAAEYCAAEKSAVERVCALGSVPEGGRVTFTEPVGDSMVLSVEAEKLAGRLVVLRWQTVYSGPWEPEETIEVWNGVA